MINIYIDESGSFAEANFVGAWNVTAALVLPGSELRKCRELLRRLKVKSGYSSAEEVKLVNLSEDNFIWFLDELGKTASSVFCVATDAGVQSSDGIANHRDAQAGKVEEHKDKMLHVDGERALSKLADQIRGLPPQLHLQLVCQVELIWELVEGSILYYVQRVPRQLNRFRWRIDEKAGGTTNFEKTFRTVIPAILQSKSLVKPGVHVIEFDYSAMKDFFYTKENAPTYLKEHYGIEIRGEGGLNLNKLVWDDFEFVDSKREEGVQIIDLIASGIRRCLRGDFEDSLRVAGSIGRLFVETKDSEFPIRFIRITGDDQQVNKIAAEAAEKFRFYQKQLMA